LPVRPFMPLPAAHTLLRTSETLLIAATGGILFDLARFPAGWIAGSMIFSAAAALAGRPLGLPTNLARAFYIVLGISIGAVATPKTVLGMTTWPLSIAAVTVAMGCVTLGTTLYLKRVHGWDTLTAVFGGIPGGLSQVMVLAAEQGLDLRKIAIVQSTRVLILAVCVPAGLGLAGLAGPASPKRPSPAGTHTARMITRMVCTMAIARRSSPCSAASTITCESPPGMPPNTAVMVSQPCTRLRYATVPIVTAPIATVTARMLSGQIVIPATVCGVATAPIDMPSTM